MDNLNALILGIVEGLTEFLPVSSTGHMILATTVLGVDITDFVRSFLIIIQLGSILAVLFVFWRRLVQGIDIWLKLLCGFFPTGFIGFGLSNFTEQLFNGFVVAFMLVLGGFIFIFIELSHKKKMANLSVNLAENSNFSVNLADLNSNLTPKIAKNRSSNLNSTFSTQENSALNLSQNSLNSAQISPNSSQNIAFKNQNEILKTKNSAQISAQKAQPKPYKINSLKEIGFKEAFLIGLCQSFALVPGTSRSGASIVGGLVLGLNRKIAAEFSFLLAIPTIFAATIYSICKEIFVATEGGFVLDFTVPIFTPEALTPLLIGFITAFFVAILIIKAFLNFISKFSFIAFGIYRIALGMLFFVLFFSGILSANGVF